MGPHNFSSPLTEFVITQPIYCVFVLMGSLTVVLNMLLICKVNSHRQEKRPYVILSLLCCDMFIGLCAVVFTSVYYHAVTMQPQQTSCDSQLRGLVHVPSTSALFAKICLLLHVEYYVCVKKKQNVIILLLNWFTALCVFGSNWNHAVNVAACRFVWMTVFTYSHLLLASYVIFCLSVMLVLNTARHGNMRIETIITIEAY